MNFLSNVLDAIPVVGHVKGVVHYAVGDSEGGHKAMIQSTRTSAVLAGGAVGCLAGPAGAVAGAMYAGVATDTVTSIVTQKPQGIIQGVDNVANDIKSGKNPTGSILSTSVQIGLDGVGGLGMGGLSALAENVSTKTIANLTTKKVSEEVVKKAIIRSAAQAEVTMVSSHIALNASKRVYTEYEDERRRLEEEIKKDSERRAQQEREKRAERERREKEEREKRAEREKREKEEREKRDNQAKNDRSSATNSGSSQPPQRNDDNDKKMNESDEFEIFMELLKELLKHISHIFKDLSPAQKEYLVKTFNILQKNDTLIEVVKIVIQIFKDHFSSDISFPNFLSLLEFVQAYIDNALAERITTLRGNTSTRPKTSYKERRKQIINEIISEVDIIQQVVNLFNKIKEEIQNETIAPNNIYPNFRDIFSAVYHYFKHRCVPGDGILTVKQYYDWIRKVLENLKKTPEYAQLIKSAQTKTIRYEMYVVLFGRRFRIVVKFYRGGTILNSAYVVKIIFPNDKEGDIFITII